MGLFQLRALYVSVDSVAFDSVSVDTFDVNTHKLFCINLARRRTELELTQQEVADRLDLPIRAYQAYEYAYKTGGRPWPRPERIDEIAKALKCKPIEFFREI